jgi:hypothetical protein
MAMKKKSFVVSLLAVALTGALLVVFVQSRDSDKMENNSVAKPADTISIDQSDASDVLTADSKDKAANDQALASMQEQLTELHEELIELQLDTDRNGSRHSVLSTESDDEPIIVSEAEQERIMLEQMDAIENDFQSEEFDDDWSIMAEDRIIEVFDNPNLSSHYLQSMECRSSLCKLEVSHDQSADMTDFRFKLRDKITDILPAGAIRPGGKGVSVIYLAKDSNSFSNTHSSSN